MKDMDEWDSAFAQKSSGASTGMTKTELQEKFKLGRDKTGRMIKLAIANGKIECVFEKRPMINGIVAPTTVYRLVQKKKV